MGTIMFDSIKGCEIESHRTTLVYGEKHLTAKERFR